MHNVAVLALDNSSRSISESPARCSRGCGCPTALRHTMSAYAPNGQRSHTRVRLRVPGRLPDVATANTVLVPGIEDIDTPVSPRVIASLQAAWQNGARVVSICTGAFVLGAADCSMASAPTTHWLVTDDLARRHPTATVEPDMLFVDEDRLVTSAGASAGLDMCLHLVRRDHGQAVAAHAARLPRRATQPRRRTSAVHPSSAAKC